MQIEVRIMTIKIFFPCAVIMALTVTHAIAVEGKSKNIIVTTKPVTAKDSNIESITPLPPNTFRDPATGLDMIYVNAGCFLMGDSSGLGGPEEKPVHEVCVDNFYIGKYEVTQGQWKSVMGSNPSIHTVCGANCPVENVSWNEVQSFLSKLNTNKTKVKISSGQYRLPTEAEWEYSARSAGKSEQYSGGEILADVAWYYYFSGEDGYRWGTQPVGAKRPNGIGLFDMTGNVWEWTNDWFGSDFYASSPRKNPVGPVSGDRRVLRGGGWRNGAYDLRTSYRNYLKPDYRSDSVGFRLLKTM